MVNTSTIGIPDYFRCYKLTDGSIVHVKIDDTAGQERFKKTLPDNYFRNADCCLLVYDIANKESFEECKKYYTPKIKELCKKNIQIILLGNKADLEEDRQVKSEDASIFALENGYRFLETSCLKNTNVASAFETLIENTNIEAQKNKQNKKNKGEKLSKNNSNKKKEDSGGCGC